ncbi:MAG: DUF418 domain-containing protein, partial [Candidatus Heimdallarchaeota archaeon]
MKADNNGPQFLIMLLKFIEGKAAATFVVLAGVGVSLMTKNWNETNKWNLRKKLMKRSLFLFLVGLIFMSIWTADILHFYAFYMIIAAFLFTVNSQSLIKWGIVFVVAFLLLLAIIDYNSGWDFNSLEYTDFWTLNGMLRSIFYNGFHSVFPWASFLIVGMWLGRQNIQDVETQNKILYMGIILLIASTLLSFIGNYLFNFKDAKYVFGTQPLPPFPLFIMMGVGTAFVIIILSVQITIKWARSALIIWMVETGQLAMTSYIAHIVVGLGLLEVMGLLYLDQGLSLWFALGYSIFFYFALIVFSHYWKRHYLRGPLEELMRKLTT